MFLLHLSVGLHEKFSSDCGAGAFYENALIADENAF